jgi:hypothetical protein
VDSVVGSYVKSAVVASDDTRPDLWNRSGTGDVQFTDIRLLNGSGVPSTTFGMGEAIIVEFGLRVHRPSPSLSLAMHVTRVETEQSVLHLVNEDCGFSVDNLQVGVHRFRVELPNCMLYPSSYSIMLWSGVINHATFDVIENAASFLVFQSNVSKRTFPFSSTRGVYFQPSSWDRIA